MLGLAGYLLLGGHLNLPMPGRQVSGRTGVLSVYTLGIFSGMASACCAPVLAGVIALSSVAASFWLALGLGTGYVFGMVAPLFVIALLWERYDWRVSRLFRPRPLTWRLGHFHRTLTVTNLASSLLLLLIGCGMILVGLSANAMPTPTGWAASLSAELQHIGQGASQALAWLPNWVVVALLLLVAAWLARRALRQVGTGDDEAVSIPDATQPPTDGPASAEEPGVPQKEEVVGY